MKRWIEDKLTSIIARYLVWKYEHYPLERYKISVREGFKEVVKKIYINELSEDSDNIIRESIDSYYNYLKKESNSILDMDRIIEKEYKRAIKIYLKKKQRDW